MNSDNDGNAPQRPPIDPTGSAAPPPPPGPPANMWPPPPQHRDDAKRSTVTHKVMTSLITSVLLISIVMNVYFAIFLAASMKPGAIEKVYDKGDTDQRIVIVPIDGLIDDSTAKFVRDAVHALREDAPKAIVLRVESGGGTVGASDRIWHELTRMQKDLSIPVVASFGSIAASGGYYVAAPADHIFAEPTTITGSIGVMANVFTVHEMLEKIGVSPEVMAATESSEKTVANDITRAWTDKDRELVRHILDTARERFVEIVQQGRAGKMTPEQILEATTGKVFTAREALDGNLVDEEGYLDAAIDHAKKLAKIDAAIDPHVTIMEPVGGFGLLGLLGSNRGVKVDAPLSSRQIRRWLAELSAPRVEYRLGPGALH